MMQIPELTEVLKLKAGENGLEQSVRWGYFADCLQCVKSEYRIEYPAEGWCAGRILFNRCRRYPKGLWLSEGVCSGDTGNGCSVQYDRLFQWKQPDHLGYGPGIGTDASGMTSNGVLYEYPAGCQPDKDRSCSTGIYHSGNYSEHRILSVLHPCEKRNCFGRMTG